MQDGTGGSAVDACERVIRRSILSGELAPGDRLPPERPLAEQLGVNRTTLRAALSRLASARLLTVRQGSGYLVQDHRLVAGLELLPELAELASEQDAGAGFGAIVRDLLEVRRRLAEMAFERLAERATPEIADRVAAAVDRLEGVAARGGSAAELAGADLEVTAALLDGTGSVVLGLCLNPVSLVLRELTPLRDHMYAAPEENVAAYRLVVAWLRAPSREAVGLLLEELARRDRATAAAFPPPR